jgi:hypothetical protein
MHDEDEEVALAAEQAAQHKRAERDARNEVVIKLALEKIDNSVKPFDGMLQGSFFADVSGRGENLHMVDVEFTNIGQAWEWVDSYHLKADAEIRDPHGSFNKPCTVQVGLIAFLLATLNEGNES